MLENQTVSLAVGSGDDDVWRRINFCGHSAGEGGNNCSNDDGGNQHEHDADNRGYCIFFL